jgi:hypothetical protein
MLFVIVLGVLFLYPPTASWALRGGGAPRLWLAFVGGLALLIFFAIVLGRIFFVPDTTRLVLFICAIGGLSLLITTASLHLSRAFDVNRSVEALAALGGGIAGLAGGIVLAVYGLRPW